MAVASLFAAGLGGGAYVAGQWDPFDPGGDDPPIPACFPASQNCGGLGQLACIRCNGQPCDRPPYEPCMIETCQGSLTLQNGLCNINGRSNWPVYRLDMTRSEANCGGQTGVSCWMLDDRDRDHLTMDTNQLNFVQTLSGPMPANGRYIYILSPVKGLVIRRYDRAHDGPLASCLDYGRYRYPSNQRPTEYLHVRHSQLVGNWTDGVNCAGEMRVSGGRIDRLNNASGHYQPNASCLANVRIALQAMNYDLSALASGPYDQPAYSAAENSCPPGNPPDPGQDDDWPNHDEL